YYAQIDPASANISISKIASGTPTDLTTGSFTFSASTFYWIRFRAVGNTLKAKFWADGSAEPGNWTITTTDSTYSSGQFGLRTFPGSSTANTQFDNFTVTDASTGDTTSIRTRVATKVTKS